MNITELPQRLKNAYVNAVIDHANHDLDYDEYTDEEELTQNLVALNYDAESVLARISRLKSSGPMYADDVQMLESLHEAKHAIGFLLTHNNIENLERIRKEIVLPAVKRLEKRFVISHELGENTYGAMKVVDFAYREKCLNDFRSWKSFDYYMDSTCCIDDPETIELFRKHREKTAIRRMENQAAWKEKQNETKKYNNLIGDYVAA